jgi:CRISPR-associated protein Cmr2
MNKEELFLYKVGALLHDPLDKSWIITGRLEAPLQPFELMGAHEREAYNLAIKILGGTVLEKVINEYNKYLFSNKVIKPADRFASGVDRVFLDEFLPDNKKRIVEKDIKIRNPFNPEYEKDIPQEILKDKIFNFTECLKNILNGINDVKLAYLALYAFYELAWIKNNLPISPADTRVPTHSIFDHNYATTTAVNFFIDSNGNPNGLVIVIDVPSVQEYIKSSRKLRDLWVSSYLVSVLVWSTIKEFIKLYGPDILILPTTRFNPFFYHYVLSELSRYKDFIKKIKNLLSIKNDELNIFDVEKGYPRFAIIPATVTLFLPSLSYLNNDEEIRKLMAEYGISGTLDKSGLEKMIKEIFKKKWSILYESIIKVIRKIDKEKDIDKLNRHLIEKLEKIKGIFKFDKISPFGLRVVIFEVSEVVADVAKSGMNINLPYVIYNEIFNKINYELAKKKHLKVKSFVDLNLTQLTQDIYNGKNILDEKDGGGGFEYCTNCGILPSIVHFPASDEEYKKFLKNIGLANKKEIDEFTTYYSQGEKLCPYCLIKRLFTIKDYALASLEELLGKINAKFKFELKIPSLADISTYEFKDELVNKVIKYSVDKKILENLYDFLRKLELVRERAKTSNWLYINRKIEEIEESGLSHDEKADLEMILMLESEDLFFKKDEEKGIDRRRDWMSIAKSLDMQTSPRTYYGLIKSDADNMGKLISGDIKEMLKIDLKEYLKRAYNLKDIMSEDEINGTIEKIVTFYEKQLKPFRLGRGFLVSLSYHAALSRALILNALYDAKIIEDELDGFIVYSGGDDLLALVPVSKALRVVERTREFFESGNSKYFYKLNDNYYLVPTIAITGRSYSLYIAHYKYPMYTIITNSNFYLESVAKESKWKMYNNIYKKDSLILIYSPRGGDIFSVLPLSNLVNGKSSIETLIEIVDKINEGKITTRLVYELYNKDNLLRWNLIKNKEILIKDIIHIVERHIKTEYKKEVKFLQDYLDKAYDVENEEIKEEREKHLFSQLFKSVRIILGGLRGE